MDNIFECARFITTEYHPYFGRQTTPWGEKRPRLYQHTDLAEWKGLPMFVRDFTITDTADASLSFTSLGCSDIFINGRRVADGDELKPGWSDYLKRTLYVTYDISGFVTEGRNRILFVLSNGWYSGRIAGERFGYNSPALLAKIKAGNEEFVTDSSWLCKVGGQIRTADIWDGEYRDGSIDDYSVISKPDYELKEWKEADTASGFEGEVTAFIGTKVRRRDALAIKPRTITVSDGIDYNGSDYGRIHVCKENAPLPVKMLRGQKITIDFGQETVGWVKIKAKGTAGTTIKMRYAEFLNDSGEISRGNDGPEGSVYTINLRSALGKAYYVLGSDNCEEYRPTFTFFGYRFVELSADGEVEFSEITAEIVGNDNYETGRIETSDALVNKLISNALWGQRGNYLSVPTDCPQRDERLGWTGDAQAFSVTAAYNADVYGFFRKWMQDMRDSQSESGGYADVNPRVGCCSSEDACAWGDAGVIIPYNMYRIYGDKTILEEHFDSMEKYMQGLVTKYGYSGPIPRYGDWLAYDWCDNKFCSSAYFIHDIDLMTEMSDALGKADRAGFYRELRKPALKFFNDNFMKDGKLIEQTQCNKILSLAFNLLEEDYALKVADELEQQIKDNGSRLSCGFLGTYNLCPTLSKYGKDKLAYTLLMQRNEPSWLYSIDQGATTIWERWNSYTKEKGFGDVGMNSFNHYAYGSIVEWMYRYMAGIEAAEPGFTKILLNPRIDTRSDDELFEGQKRMTFVKCSFESAAGLIRSCWNTENGFTYSCTVPEGATATLILPAIGGEVVINGVSHKEDEFTKKDGNFVIELAPGEYEFIQ